MFALFLRRSKRGQRHDPAVANKVGFETCFSNGILEGAVVCSELKMRNEVSFFSVSHLCPRVFTGKHRLLVEVGRSPFSSLFPHLLCTSPIYLNFRMGSSMSIGLQSRYGHILQGSSKRKVPK